MRVISFEIAKIWFQEFEVFYTRLYSEGQNLPVSIQKYSPTTTTVSPELWQNMAEKAYKREGDHVTPTSLRFQSLSASALVISPLKFCCVSPFYVVFQFAVVYQKIVLCSEKDCCVLRKIVVF